MAEQACWRSGEEKENGESKGITVCGMQFAYELQHPLFFDFNLDIARGSRCLLVGANGSGNFNHFRFHFPSNSDDFKKKKKESTWLAEENVVRVLDRSAFHDTQLVCSGDLAYLGGSWSKTIGSAGEIPLQGDFSAEHMIFGVEGIDPVRRHKLIELLDIDLQWRMHKVLLLDEVTVDLDVVARMDLLDFFKEECEQRGATVVYATHIFDGLETWATHLAYIQDGQLKRSEKLTEINELKSSENLLSVVEAWLRSETKSDKKKPSNTPVRVQKASPYGTSPFMSSRQMAYYR
ncbi:hypothetical protein V6N13_128169 [Hibiscus sabdariffa]